MPYLLAQERARGDEEVAAGRAERLPQPEHAHEGQPVQAHRQARPAGRLGTQQLLRGAASAARMTRALTRRHQGHGCDDAQQRDQQGGFDRGRGERVVVGDQSEEGGQRPAQQEPQQRAGERDGQRQGQVVGQQGARWCGARPDWVPMTTESRTIRSRENSART